MRVDPNLYTNVNASMQQTEQSLQTAMNQLSSGKRVSKPSDDPLAFAADLQSVATSASVDRYSKNADAVAGQAQLADSALNSVVAALTKALSLGVQGGDGTLTADQRSSLTQQVQGIFAEVLTQANATSNGVALFAGTAATSAPFAADATSPSGYTYTGNSGSNQAQVGSGLSVTVNVPGDSVFANANGDVFGSLKKMVTALQGGSAAAIGDATAAISAAIAHIGQVRVVYGNTVNQLNAENDYLSRETISLSSQQDSLVNVDFATAVTNLTQAQTAHSAVLAMAAKILPTSLLNYLQG